MCKGRSKTWMSLFLINLPISVFLITLPLQANAYSIHGNVLAHTAVRGGDVITIDRSTNAGTATFLSDSAISLGIDGLSAESAYFADLSTGLLGTYISGNSPNAAEYAGGSASAEATVSFNDSLTFNIPAGTYASDLYVSANGFVNGILSAFGCDGALQNERCANVLETWTFSFGHDALSDIVHTYPNNSPTEISENFTLTTRILAAGTYLTDQTAFASVSAALHGKGTTLNLYPSTGDTSSSFVADFYNTGGFTSLATPDGVTWTSDSGVFLSAVPVPAAVWLFGSGLIGLIVVSRRKT